MATKKSFIPLKELEKRLFNKKGKKTEKFQIVEHTKASRQRVGKKTQSQTGQPLYRSPKTAPVNFSEPIQMSKSQLMARASVEGGGSPLEITLQQSESLKAAQARISTLEGELQKFRQDNESLISTAEVLKESREQLMAENEELRRNQEEIQESFADEKDVLLNTLEEIKREKSRLVDINKNLEKRLSADLQNVRTRELALEGQMEILKLEGVALQREKDGKIIDLQKTNRKLNNNLFSSHKKIQELQTQVNKLRDNVRKSLSVLRATIHNLEGLPFDAENTSATEEDFDEKKTDFS